MTGSSSRVVGGWARSRAIVSAMIAQVVDPHGDLVGGVAPVLPGQLVEALRQRRALRLQRRRQFGDEQRRADAVLVADQVGRDGVAQRLLVAEDEVGRGPGDPLEAGERLGVRRRRGARRSPAASSTTRSSWRRCRVRPWPATRRRAARRPRRRAASATRRPVRLRHRDRAPVGVGVVGDDHVGVAPSRARANARSSAPGSSGLGNATVGKSGSGCSCCGTAMSGANPAAANTLRTTGGADAVHRGVHDADVPRAGADKAGDGGDVVRRRSTRRARDYPSASSGISRTGPTEPGSRPRSRCRSVGRSGRRRRRRPCSRCRRAGCARR